MRKSITAVALACAWLAAPAFAAEEAKKPMTAQQGKMATCNKEATGKTGDERKAFMKQCLSAKSISTSAGTSTATTAGADPKAAQQSKMKACNKDATGKTGDERKAFMKECLSK
ncbi:PsiF family protein [Methylibium rhizosphaerae]|uniref:PsiF family protein n=1 Tax=Methylibium rhizosphaerae TaxID=2570323 RepID=UPI0011295BB5